MRIAFHFIIGVIIFILVSVHLLVIGLFILCPTPVLLNVALAHDVEYVDFSQIPSHVSQIFSEDKPVTVPLDDNPIHRIASEVLVAKERRFFDDDEKHELYLNALDFGGNVIGIESASRYYFHKSVSDLSFEDALTLAGLYKIFRN